MWNEEAAANPFWTALSTEQAYLAIGGDLARRFPAEVLPFAAVAEVSVAAIEALGDLLAPEEVVLITAAPGMEIPQVEGVAVSRLLTCWQMRFPAGTDLATSPAPGTEVVEMREADAGAMVELTGVAFPGFFRPGSYRLGSYFGVRVEGQLVAMGGERVALPGAREISALCTRPGHTGKGYAALLLHHLLRRHEALGTESFLHVTDTNLRAVTLYERLGFERVRSFDIHRVIRKKQPLPIPCIQGLVEGEWMADAPKVLQAEQIDGGVLISFDDGRTALYSDV